MKYDRPLARGFDGRSNVSRTVGWVKRTLTWPTVDEVETAIANKDAVKLLTWRRFLGPTEGDDQRGIMSRIVDVEAQIRAEVEA